MGQHLKMARCFRPRDGRCARCCRGVFCLPLMAVADKGSPPMSLFADFMVWIVLAQAEGAGGNGAGGNGGGGGFLETYGTFLPFIAIGILFYLMLIRPERRKRAEMTDMLGNLKANDRVVTAGGIHGTIVTASKESETVTIRVDETNNTKLRMSRSSIVRVVTDKESGDKSEKKDSL
jgi:preprotein translocase subunit YajC